jgi:hypothetical protein
MEIDIPKLNIKIVERDQIDTPNTQREKLNRVRRA